MEIKLETLEQKDQNGSEVHWKSYQEYTEDLSVNSRKLAFAGAGICWILKENTFPNTIIVSLFFIVIYFLFDILQYLVAAVSLRIWLRVKEKDYQTKNDTIKGSYEKPAFLDVIPFWLWILKIVSLITGYAFIGIHMIGTYS